MDTAKPAEGNQPETPKAARITRVALRHETCGGRADLVVAYHLEGISYRIHCHECGYTESWSADPTTKQPIQ